MRTGFLFLVLTTFSLACGQLLPVDSVWIARTLRQMSIEEKVGHLLMPVHQSLDQSRQYVQQYHVGGFWFAKAKAPAIVHELNALQRLSRWGLLIAADFEKGVGTHVDGGIDLPGAMALAATGDTAAVYQAAAITAQEARAIGVHLDFAPVVDVNNNPKNPVINVRSFGENPALVAMYGAAAVRGYQDHGLLSTLKHYPGHGNTTVDTHVDLATIGGSMKELQEVELQPYRTILSEARPAAVMVSHLWVPAIDTVPVPATFSARAVTGILRQQLGFDGIICTDAMVMGAIREHYDSADAAVKAVLAGVDLIVWPQDVAEAYHSLLTAARSGRIGEERLNASVRRILSAKTRVGLQRQREIVEENVLASLSTAENLERAGRIAGKCITLARDDRHLIPLSPDQRVLLLTLDNHTGPALMSRTSVTFPFEIEKRAVSVLSVSLPDTLSREKAAQLLELAQRAEVVVVGAYVRIFMASGSVDLPADKQKLLEQLAEVNSNLVLVSFGNPYVGAAIRGLSTYLCAYDNADVLQLAAARALYGEIRIQGSLPVTVNASLPAGSGIRLEPRPE